ncbi:nucleotide exchange factor GrpE [Candidatus Dependentiae bacterium]|nr:nucleotide exchange factor GrpE [Candidatus Dependentiae bacterium]
MANKKNKKEENNNSKKNDQNSELSSLKSQLIRVNADFENFKKRVTKERAEWEILAQAEIVNAFLPLIDDLERALQNSKKEKDSVLFGGLNIILKNVKKTFDNLGIKEIDCDNGFDPDLHEALIQVDSKKHKTGEIVQVLNKGYTFKDMVIRHAKVSVAK